MIRKGRSIKLSVIIILFTVLLIALASGLIVISMQNNKTIKGETPNSSKPEAEKPRFDSNNWDNAIITEVKQDIPIPRGFEYISGDKTTGIIVANKKENIGMIWIPYDEKANEIDISKYFAKVDNYQEADSDIIKSMQKYGGFFAYLYTTDLKYNDLESITKEKYNELIKYDDLNKYIESIHTHLLCKQELQQIEYYLKNSKIEYLIGTTGVTIEPYSTLYIDEDSIETSRLEANPIKLATAKNIDGVLIKEGDLNKQAAVYMLKTKEYEVPVPVGYRYAVDVNGIVSIQDASNKNLVYVWVPLKESELSTAKSTIKSLYENWKNEEGEKLDLTEGSALYGTFNSTKEELSSEFKDSIKKYGGFYISEAELSYDSNNKYYNKARGMVNYSATETKTGGDYFRQNAKYKTFDYSDMVDVSSKVAGENPTVVSHLTYGVEYDATVLWIQQTNKDYKDSKENDINTVLIQNSTYVGKYSNSNSKKDETAIKSSEFFNGIWGLGGNLAEVTQEKYKISGNKELCVVRGGSYATTGQVAPIACRKIVGNCSGSAIGFRVCLYVVPDAKKANQILPKFEKDNEDYENEITTDNPSDNTTIPGGATTNPGTTTDQGGATTNPGTTTDQGGATTNPGTTTDQGGATTNPGTTTTPGGTTTNPGTPTQYPIIANSSNTIKVGASGSVAVTIPTGWNYSGCSGTGAAVTNIGYSNGYISYKGVKEGTETITLYFKYQNGESHALSHTIIVNATTQTQPTQYPIIASNSNTIKVGESGSVAVTIPTGWNYSGCSGTGATVTNIGYSNGYISYKGAKAGKETITLYFKDQNGKNYVLSHTVTVNLPENFKPIQYPKLSNTFASIKVGASGRVAVTVPTGWNYSGCSGTGTAVTNIGYSNGYISYKGEKAGMETITLYFKYQNGETKALSHTVIVVK